MKKQLWKFALALALLVALLAVGTIATSAATEGYYTYTVTNGEATITDFPTTVTGKITIPSTLGSYPVTSIGDYAFSWCSSLTSITIPDSVTSIGKYAFRSCRGLTSITIPESVTSIGDYAFQYCSGLTSIAVDAGNSAYHSAGNCLIETASKTLIAGCKNSIIPTDGSVTSIGASAFEDCTGLTSITIPESVTSIGDYAFYWCESLASITFESSNTAIYDSADTISDTATIYGYEGSTAQAYAEKYNRGFVSMGPAYTLGDLDGVEGVEASDAIYLLYNVIFGEESYPVDQPCDFNGDGATDATDAIYLLYHVIFGAANYPLNS